MCVERYWLGDFRTGNEIIHPVISYVRIIIYTVGVLDGSITGHNGYTASIFPDAYTTKGRGMVDGDDRKGDAWRRRRRLTLLNTFLSGHCAKNKKKTIRSTCSPSGHPCTGRRRVTERGLSYLYFSYTVNGTEAERHRDVNCQRPDVTERVRREKNKRIT